MSPAPRTFSGPRNKAAYDECTRDPIFLFQRRAWNLTSEPAGYEYVEDHGWVPEGVVTDAHDEGCDELPEALSWQQLSELGCAVEEWHTEKVFLSRTEGEDHGKARAYNYLDGWRVYCVPAHGQLAKLLRDQGEAYWSPPKHEELVKILLQDETLLKCMQHAVGWPGLHRNRYAAGAGSAESAALDRGVAFGMISSGRPSELTGGDVPYWVTERGKDVLALVALVRAAGKAPA